MTTRRLLASLALLALLAVACGRLNDSGGGGIDHPTGADQPVLRMDTAGGFVPPSYSMRQIPTWSLYGDGRLITQGPQIEIYPPPALPNVLVTPISEDGVQAILQAAKDTGLMGPNADYPYACITDMPVTTFTLVADGQTHVISAYALGQAQGPCPGADTEARDKLAAFQAKLTDLQSWLPEGSIGGEKSFDPSELRVYVQPYTGTGDPNLTEPPQAWPLQTPLATFGEASKDLQDTRCGVVSGADLTTLLPEAQRSNQLTPWTSDGTEYLLIFRPLLPDEHGC
jgi:hypothetical protein